MELQMLKQTLISEHMIIINKNVYSNPHDEIGDNKTEITE